METTDAEASVIGAVLLSNGEVLDDLSLTPNDFYNPRYGKVYEIMQVMRRNQEPIDPITLYENADYRALQWTTPILAHEWASAVPTYKNVSYYAELVGQASIRRRLADAGMLITQRAKDTDFASLAELSRSAVDNALGIAKNPIRFIFEEINETIEQLSTPSKAMKTPWLGLTSAIGGWRRGALYIIGARPGKGKTSIGLQAAIELSKYGSVALSSLEMRREEIHKRLMSTTASIPMDALMNNKMTEGDWEKWAILQSSIQPNIAINDRAEVSIQDIRIHARSVNRLKPLAGIVVDYLQLMTTRDNKPRHEVVSEFSRQLKIMARELDVPVIALSQLNRASETRVDKRPSLGDLRESGAIEQDADVVILLHIDEDDTMTMDVAKNRHGAQALVKLKWEGQYARAV